MHLGVPVYDADSHAKMVMTTDGILVAAIKKEFGDLAYDELGNLNRAYLANTVFQDEHQLAHLNSLVHPRVALDYSSWVKKQLTPYVLKEAALLFESNSYKVLDKVIVITASEEMRIARVLKRDPHRTVEQINGIVEKQMPENEKVKRADYLVVNDETTLVVPQVLDLHRVFTTLALQN
jgi:dephospho-CoA kinase